MKRELSHMLARDLKDERIAGIVSIVDIELTHDCRSARVIYFRIRRRNATTRHA